MRFRRPWLPAAVAALAVLAARTAQLAPHPTGTDFIGFWVAGRATWQGADPYAAVRALHDGYPFFYPGWTALLLAPAGALPFRLGWLAFAALSGYAYGLAGQRYGRGLLVGCCSAAFMQTAIEGQWSILLTAAAVLPALSPLLAMKPSLGLALFIARPSRWAVGGGVALLVISLLVLPGWPAEWLASLRASHHLPPVLRPWGWLLLLAWLRWRTPEGRLLGALALIPHMPTVGELLPLFLIPRTRRDAYGLALLTYVAAFAGAWLYPAVPGAPFPAVVGTRWPVVFVCGYLPALVLVLRQPIIPATKERTPAPPPPPPPTLAGAEPA